MTGSVSQNPEILVAIDSYSTIDIEASWLPYDLLEIFGSRFGSQFPKSWVKILMDPHASPQEIRTRRGGVCSLFCPIIASQTDKEIT